VGDQTSEQRDTNSVFRKRNHYCSSRSSSSKQSVDGWIDGWMDGWMALSHTLGPFSILYPPSLCCCSSSKRPGSPTHTHHSQQLSSVLSSRLLPNWICLLLLVTTVNDLRDHLHTRILNLTRLSPHPSTTTTHSPPFLRLLLTFHNEQDPCVHKARVLSTGYQYRAGLPDVHSTIVRILLRLDHRTTPILLLSDFASLQHRRPGSGSHLFSPTLASSFLACSMSVISCASPAS
jgi:hypothetical protein